MGLKIYSVTSVHAGSGDDGCVIDEPSQPLDEQLPLFEQLPNQIGFIRGARVDRTSSVDGKTLAWHIQHGTSSFDCKIIGDSMRTRKRTGN